MKKRIISGFLIAVIGIAGTIYGVSIKNKNKDLIANKIITNIKSKQNDEIINVKENVDLIKVYDNIESLKKNSEIIVRGIVLDTTSYVSGPGVLTEYKLKVSKSYNNNAKAGDIVTIASSGGIVDYEEYSKINGNNDKDFEKNISKDNLKNTKIKMTIGDNDLIEKSKEYIIFANTKKVSLNKKMYCTLNVYQGQFNLDTTNNRVINKSLEYNKSINEFEKEIQQ